MELIFFIFESQENITPEQTIKKVENKMKLEIEVSEDLAFIIKNFERITNESNLIEEAFETAIRQWYDNNTSIKSLAKDFRELI